MKPIVHFFFALILILPLNAYSQSEWLVEYNDSTSFSNVRLFSSFEDTTYLTALLSKHDTSLGRPYHGRHGTPLGIKLIGNIIDSTDTVVRGAFSSFVIGSASNGHFGISSVVSEAVTGQIIHDCEQPVIASYNSELDTSISVFFGKCGSYKVFDFEHFNGEIHLLIESSDDSTYYQRWTDDLILTKEFNLGHGIEGASLNMNDELIYFISPGSTSLKRNLSSIDTSGSVTNIVSNFDISFDSQRFVIGDSVIIHMNGYARADNITVESYDFSGSSKGSSSISSDGDKTLHARFVKMLDGGEYVLIINEPRLGTIDPVRLYHFSSSSSLIASGFFGFETVLATGFRLDRATGEFIVVGNTQLEYTDTTKIDNEKIYILKGDLGDLTPYSMALDCKVFPNPIKDGVAITIEITSKKELALDTIKVFDTNGASVKINQVSFDSNILEIETNSLKTGIYFFRLKLKGFDNVLTSKFTVE